MDLLQTNPAKFIALERYAATFPDFPQDFVYPSLLDPKYIPPTSYERMEKYAYVMGAISTIVVVLRLWIRKRVTVLVWGVDDWLIIPGQLLSIAMIVNVILMIRTGGLGKHIYDVQYSTIYRCFQLEFSGVLLYFITVFFIRMSIAASLYRFIGLSSRPKRILMHATSLLLILQFLVQVLAYVFAYSPISAGWNMDVRIAGFKSIDLALEIFVLTIVYLLTDVWLLVLPIYTIWNLQLPTRARVGVLWIFVFGFVACVGAVVKTVFVRRTFESWDPTWHGVNFTVGAVTEITFGAISASMPALNHIIVHTLPGTLESRFGSSKFSLGNEQPRSFYETLTFGKRSEGPCGQAGSFANTDNWPSKTRADARDGNMDRSTEWINSEGGDEEIEATSIGASEALRWVEITQSTKYYTHAKAIS
ncbi:hypothetical protein BCR34DRAFT_614882 [Clohesyomyces aquaticus]|uniref:Rhodopsin domain-containing protein n=1 Tax=Clohesyomyces aquaticus TaxID=1231657 RepID=A0A1Y1ZL26_9PLEO|nr:hypothetical protein BCR34DRAFT_614882 [Clohesyomyces aquaticus]